MSFYKLFIYKLLFTSYGLLNWEGHDSSKKYNKNTIPKKIILSNKNMFQQ